MQYDNIDMCGNYNNDNDNSNTYDDDDNDNNNDDDNGDGDIIDDNNDNDDYKDDDDDNNDDDNNDNNDNCDNTIMIAIIKRGRITTQSNSVVLYNCYRLLQIINQFTIKEGEYASLPTETIHMIMQLLN